jgi:hypothetical protein
MAKDYFIYSSKSIENIEKGGSPWITGKGGLTSRQIPPLAEIKAGGYKTAHTQHLTIALPAVRIARINYWRLLYASEAGWIVY